ncbi:5'-nucleotidase, lipoprotein e(P4) family [Clostridium tarantellae]|uniref:5'-nucleotidase, lipoprotein e(P4) family n=1 Tax=Clostridium tarantellae TaxID=39493 RepID=A0A6I1MR48_9CLOT|nr:5'-nucleotidase, lipoprotein e(P4) family [Clostridium tarantellae]MPQ44647.1 5'-nucleotidase, lipoprotein e(P4) family [Clostridium tarantellae]
MKNKFISYLLVGVLTFGAGIGTGYAVDNAKNNSDKNALNELTNGNVLATVWQQESGEAKALRYQAYNSAMNYIDEISARPSDKPYAVTLDLDETVVDNIPHAGYVIKNNELFSNDNFNKWCNMSAAKEIDGAKKFTDYAKQHGVEVFYVSNRSTDLLPGTIENMKKLNLVNADEEHVLLKADPKGPKQKDDRWNKIKEKYNLAMYCGDNLGDFPSGYDYKSNTERRQIVDENCADFGTKFIVLPNATYGDFEGAVYGYDYKKSPEQKLNDRLNIIKSFE